MKTKIQAISESQVLIEFDDLLTGERYHYEIWAPAAGGYVRYNGEKQLCERLSCSGPTLHWSAKAPLVDMIRREYRAMRRRDASIEQN
jgi:hypothetical protein